jgi:hypothetical protein
MSCPHKMPSCSGFLPTADALPTSQHSLDRTTLLGAKLGTSAKTRNLRIRPILRGGAMGSRRPY